MKFNIIFFYIIINLIAYLSVTKIFFLIKPMHEAT